MLELILIVLPLVTAVVIYCCRDLGRMIRILLPVLGGLELAVSILLLYMQGLNQSIFPGWIAGDLVGRVTAHVTAFLFFCVSLHANYWLPETRQYERHEGTAMRENTFCALLCLFLATMMLVVFARNYGLLWVAVEATTLTSAPLIAFRRSADSLEAMWKYLLICSVGIGLALFGTFLLGSAVHFGGGKPDLSFAAIAAEKTRIDPLWFKAAFLFCFAGYGLKMGLAPFHTWLPDAHSEAPSMVSVLLSGALLNCSFVGIIRVIQAAPEGVNGFCREYLAGFGLLSLLAAAFFLIRQSDYKRLLAYSSVEHMGLLALFWGLQCQGPALVHLTFHSICKMILFLTAGNILLAYGTRQADRIHGLFSRMPLSAAVWLVGILMICGMPPSPLFATELLLVKRAGPVAGSVILILLFAVFCGMTSCAFRMTMGPGPAGPASAAETAGEKLSRLPAFIIVLPLFAGTFMICKLTGVF